MGTTLTTSILVKPGGDLPAAKSSGGTAGERDGEGVLPSCDPNWAEDDAAPLNVQRFLRRDAAASGERDCGGSSFSVSNRARDVAAASSSSTTGERAMSSLGRVGSVAGGRSEESVEDTNRSVGGESGRGCVFSAADKSAGLKSAALVTDRRLSCGGSPIPRPSGKCALRRSSRSSSTGYLRGIEMSLLSSGGAVSGPVLLKNSARLEVGDTSVALSGRSGVRGVRRGNEAVDVGRLVNGATELRRRTTPCVLLRLGLTDCRLARRLSAGETAPKSGRLGRRGMLAVDDRLPAMNSRGCVDEPVVGLNFGCTVGTDRTAGAMTDPVLCETRIGAVEAPRALGKGREVVELDGTGPRPESPVSDARGLGGN